jgi:hypothetical protein
VRTRQLRGPLTPGGAPELTVVQIRRYQCQSCAAITTVVPAETLSGRLYTAAAIALALALYGLSRLASAAVRRQVSPWQVTASPGSWRTLSRWCAAADAPLFRKLRPTVGESRAVARAVAVALTAYAPPAPEPPRSMLELAFAGAARAA